MSIAHSGLPQVNTALDLKEWLLHQLLCQVDGRVLPNYCGVLGDFLLDLPLPRIVYMLDCYLPQLQPWDKGSLHELSTMAAPIHFCPQKMYMYFQRQDDEFCHYSFVNEGGNPFVLTPTDARNASTRSIMSRNLRASPLRLVGSLPLYSISAASMLFPVWSLVLSWTADHETERNGLMTRLSLLKNEVMVSRMCNPRSLDLALLKVEAARVFCDSTLRAILNEFPDILYFNLTDDTIPEHIHVREVFAISHTRTAKELTAVAQIPSSRIVRGLGLLTENVAADAFFFVASAFRPVWPGRCI